MIKVAITGATGRMGKALIEATHANDKTQVAVALERPGSTVIGADAGEIAGVGNLGVALVDDVASVTDDFDVLIDFTRPEVTLANLEACRQAGKSIVIGTTGFTDEQKQQI